jgi:hypothetical protein
MLYVTQIQCSMHEEAQIEPLGRSRVRLFYQTIPHSHLQILVLGNIIFLLLPKGMMLLACDDELFQRWVNLSKITTK